MISVPTVETLPLKFVYTDGSCSTQTRIGGWAWVCLEDGTLGSGRAVDTTNQRMEITGAFEAVKANAGRVAILSDSRYVVDAFLAGWWIRWKDNGWRTVKKTPVANRDLWEPFVDLVLARGDEVRFGWVKGHSGDEGNERADQLAALAAKGPA